jgi:hypothetical protein
MLFPCCYGDFGSGRGVARGNDAAIYDRRPRVDRCPATSGRPPSQNLPLNVPIGQTCQNSFAMRHALIALVLTPLLVSGSFGIFALIAFPFMLFMTIAVALPLLFFFRRIGRLAWWHAVSSGAICTMGFIAFSTLMTALAGVRPDIHQLVDSNNVAFIALGMLVYVEISTHLPRLTG